MGGSGEAVYEDASHLWAVRPFWESGGFVGGEFGWAGSVSLGEGACLVWV